MNYVTSLGRNSSTDPNRLSGLAQASYILSCIAEGQDEEDITTSLKGDSQLVKMWLAFLLHNHWMKKDEFGKSTITDKGSRMLETYLIKASSER